jgi:hypothetical protein
MKGNKMTDWRDAPFELSFAERKTSNAHNHKCTARRFVEDKLSKHKELPEKGTYGFSCALIDDTPHVNDKGERKGKNLRNDNAKAWSVLAFDVDGTQSYGDATQKLRDDGAAFCGYSSYSHTESVPKFRIVIFLRAPYAFDPDDHALACEVFSNAYLVVGAHFGLKFDASCKNAASLFYLPSHNDSEEACRTAFCDTAAFESGEPFDFTPYVEAARVVAIEKAQQGRRE